MIVLFRLARRYISRRFLQSLLFILGVALGVAMVIAIDIANGSAKQAFNLSAESIAGKATHQIIAGSAGISDEVYHQVRVDLGIRDSAPLVIEYVRGVGLGEQPLRLLGIDPFAESPFRSYLAVAQTNSLGFDALTTFIAEPNTILISQTLANRFGVQAGDALTLQTGTRLVEVQVVGLLQPDDRVSAQALDDLMLTDIATAQEITGLSGRLSRIDLILPTANSQILLDQIMALLPPGAQVGAISANNSTLDQMTAAFELNLQALSLLALVVGVFLIYNTVTFSVIQRRPLIGIMRSIGASRRQIFTLILGEAFLLGSVGTIFGLGLGIIFGRAAVGLVAQTISDLYFTVNVQGVTVDAFTLVKGAGIGLLASIGAALIPAYSATQTTPAGILRRSTQETAAQKLVPLLTLLAIGLNIGGLLLLQIPT
ncbi:MAG: ABC transporter permease, partial [Anaerolineae bacterium]|nr:ABC transporter permease [Anaerolineae bacterium]